MEQPFPKSIPLKKGDLLANVTVDTMAAEGKCVARLNGQVLFITGGAPGDIVDVELTKIKSAFLEGRVTAQGQWVMWRQCSIHSGFVLR